MKAITQQWLEYANADLKSCENNMNDDFLTNIVASTPNKQLKNVSKQ